MLSTLKMEKTKTTSLSSDALYITFSNFPIPVFLAFSLKSQYNERTDYPKEVSLNCQVLYWKEEPSAQFLAVE